jgi:hypothetical protein
LQNYPILSTISSKIGFAKKCMIGASVYRTTFTHICNL